ncbi:MAG: Uma2 family endonuclease [Rubrobacter sp.]|jgi:Uma2 family endonuclease|nr:Uma2 family endonuclease [Rubrobacter sp.]
MSQTAVGFDRHVYFRHERFEEVRVETIKTPAEGRTLLRNASWETYERLIEEREERRNPRFFYDRGVLEIMSPYIEHESVSRITGTLVGEIAIEMDIDVFDAGSTTYKREDLEGGFEPDECFYFGENIERVRGKKKLDLDAGVPAPDLVIEVAITSFSINKLPIYARLGVREVWRHDRERIEILALQNSEYAEVSESAFLPSATGEILTKFVADGLRMERPAWARRVREWARESG